MAVVSPPTDVPSSITITFFVFAIDSFIFSTSNGFKNLAFITSTFSNFSAIFTALDTVLPIEIIVAFFPYVKVSAFPNFFIAFKLHFSFSTSWISYYNWFS